MGSFDWCNMRVPVVTSDEISETFTAEKLGNKIVYITFDSMNKVTPTHPSPVLQA